MRIVSLLASGTEIVAALGLGEQLVGISHECDEPRWLLDRPRVTRVLLDPQAASAEIDHEVQAASAQGRPLYALDTQLLAELRPDLIIAQSQCAVCAVSDDDVRAVIAGEPRLARAKVLALHPDSLDSIFRDIAAVGQAAGAASRAAELLETLRRRVADVSGIVAEVPPEARPRVTVIEWIEPLMIASNWTPELVRMAGGLYPLAESGERSRYHDFAEVAAFDPQVLLVAPCGFDLPRTLAELGPLVAQPGWSQLTAVRERRAWALDGNAYFNRSGPRIVDTLEIMAHLLHPQEVPRPASVGEWDAVCCAIG